MFDFILRKLSKKHHFKYCSAILSESDEKLTKIAQQVYDLAEQNEGIDKQYLIAYFVHTAGLLRLVREDLNTIFDLWYNPKRSTRPLQALQVDLDRLKDEIEITIMLCGRTNHPAPLLDRAKQLHSNFKVVLGNGVKTALNMQFEELKELIFERE